MKNSCPKTIVLKSIARKQLLKKYPFQVLGDKLEILLFEGMDKNLVLKGNGTIDLEVAKAVRFAAKETANFFRKHMKQ